mgnify:CR=1 FL=1
MTMPVLSVEALQVDLPPGSDRAHAVQGLSLQLHAGQTLSSVRENTGFALPAVEPTPQTPPPTAEELRLLREEIDPHGLRDLELLGTRDRLFRIYSLVAGGAPV